VATSIALTGPAGERSYASGSMMGVDGVSLGSGCVPESWNTASALTLRQGSCKGGGIAPVLAHIFLPHGLDEWCERAVQPRLKGRSFRTRFADDLGIGCELEADAQKSMGVLPKRCARFGLRIQPTQTTLVVFRKPKARQAAAHGNGTVEFLGFTHYWARTRRGLWVIKRRTARKRLRRTQQALWQWGRHTRQAPLQYPYQMLCVKLRGHFRYYGIRGNCPLLENVRR
jgi:RNA-directed DNA polymerase